MGFLGSFGALTMTTVRIRNAARCDTGFVWKCKLGYPFTDLIKGN